MLGRNGRWERALLYEKQRGVRFRFFLYFCFLCIAGCYFIIGILIVPIPMVLLNMEELLLNDKGDALVIRQEEVYNAPEYGEGHLSFS